MTAGGPDQVPGVRVWERENVLGEAKQIKKKKDVWNWKE